MSADPTGTTTTTDGDLVVNAVFDEGQGFGFGNTNPIYDIIFGSGYSGLFGEMEYGAAAQAIIQPSSGLIKPAMTFVQKLVGSIRLYDCRRSRLLRGPARRALQAGFFGCWRHGFRKALPQ